MKQAHIQPAPPALEREEILQDYYFCCLSREVSLLIRREVLNGRAKFGVSDDGKELLQVAMAKAYPEAHFWGFDAELSSIRFAERCAQAEGVASQTTFEARPAQLVANHQYALVIVLSSLFRFDDPPSVARRIRATLEPAGSLLVIEPGFADRTEDNFTPAGRLYSALSALRQWPASGHAQTVSAAYAHRVELLLAEAGFSQIRVIACTPFLRAFEARR